MATEIERKFLLKDDSWRKLAGEGTDFRQGYLVDIGPDKIRASVRVRVEGDKANINIKSATLDMMRTEYEYPISLKDAEEMLDQLCIWPLIEKSRYKVEHGNHTWEIDVFEGDNEGLVVAELELKSAEEDYEKPDWLGEEVTEDARYYNVCLVNQPYKDW
jgi:adenylate cyclase